MMKQGLGTLLLALLAHAAFSAPLHGAKPWEILIPFKRVEADPEKAYRLTKEDGPWMILCASFAGPNAERQAHQLVLELRKEFALKAHMHQKAYDFTEPVVGLGLNRYGGPKVMRYANASRFEEIAVLVGQFESVDDPRMDKALQKIKYARPECLDLEKNNATTQRFVGLRELHRRLTSDKEKSSRGPMGNAFVTRNPMLPKEYFAPGGLDPLVLDMNRDVEFSLLKNPGMYTVRVATFRGASTMKTKEIDRRGRGLPSKLEKAAVKAHELAVLLRRKGEEAYEFHDRYESIVTIGSFDSVGSPRADGRTEIDPRVHRIMQQYAAKREQLPGQSSFGLVPRSEGGIPMDVQPLPVEVPRTSIASAYAPNNGLFR